MYTRYITDGGIKEEFLFCEGLQTTTKAADVSLLLDQIEWEKVGSVHTDGAPVMIGDRSGFAALVKVLDEIRLVILIFLL